MFNIILASPRWYCAWVDRAIGMLSDILEKYWAPIYVNHEIVHNKFIVEYFERKWVIFSDDLEKIKPWEIMIFSAHWVAPSYVEKVRAKWIRYIDASCPLVIKVHNEAKKFIADGYEVIYIWKHSHQEAIWVADNNLEKIHIISNSADLEQITFPKSQKLALLNQTTLSVDDTKALIEKVQQKYPNILLPSFSDICYATTNRQNAVKEIIPEIDKLIVVWSKNSSNSVKLRLIWDKNKIHSILIDSPHEIPDDFLDWVQSIWISSWASVSEDLVQDVISHLKALGWVFLKEVKVAEEKMIFPYDLELR